MKYLYAGSFWIALELRGVDGEITKAMDGVGNSVEITRAGKVLVTQLHPGLVAQGYSIEHGKIVLPSRAEVQS